jgi:hypothetical protein
MARFPKRKDAEDDGHPSQAGANEIRFPEDDFLRACDPPFVLEDRRKNQEARWSRKIGLTWLGEWSHSEALEIARREKAEDNAKKKGAA